MCKSLNWSTHLAGTHFLGLGHFTASVMFHLMLQVTFVSSSPCDLTSVGHKLEGQMTTPAQLYCGTPMIWFWERSHFKGGETGSVNFCHCPALLSPLCPSATGPGKKACTLADSSAYWALVDGILHPRGQSGDLHL